MKPLSPLRRLRVLVNDLQGPIKVERSIKLSQHNVEQRMLLHVPPTQRNCQLLLGLAQRSGCNTDTWLQDIQELDAIGVAASGSGSLRFYSQNSHAKTTPYYQGFKFYSGHEPRVDYYFLCSPLALFKEPIQGSGRLQNILDLTCEIIQKIPQDQLLCLKIDSARRSSFFVQCEHSAQHTKNLNKIVQKAIEKYSLSENSDIIFSNKPELMQLNHIAFGSDDVDGVFVTFYYASTVEELLVIATNH